MRLRRIIAATLCGVLVLTAPGMEAWAAMGRAVSLPTSAPVASAPVLPVDGASAALPVSLSLPAAALSPAPSAAAAPSAGPAVDAPTAQAQAVGAAAFTPSAAASSEADSSELNRTFDAAAAVKGGASDAVPSVPAAAVPADLKMPASDTDALSAWTAAFHDKVTAKYKGADKGYDFTVRDYYAWLKFIRFFTPSKGVKEAARLGALYVYGDRLEDEKETKDFAKDLEDAEKSLKLSAPKHGLDAAKAAELTRLAEPVPQTLADDEESPFQVPLKTLIPDKAKTDLVMTPTTLRRVEAAYQAFAMRDYSLLLGPPATEKSAIPKYLAAQLEVPHLAVTMHPGIGTFELVGGYRPRLVKIRTLAEASRIIKEKLAEAAKLNEYSDLLESTAKVYGVAPLEKTLKAIEDDLKAGKGKDTEADVSRRLITLAHGLELGASFLTWQDGYLTYALKRDIWITFEEMNAAPSEVLEFLNDFMRTRRLTITQKLGEPVVLTPKTEGRFMLWATMNPETDSNREVLAQTLKNRWRVKYFGHLPPFEQAEILEKRFGLPTNWALALVENFHKETNRLAVNWKIGKDWRDGYQINLRHLLKTVRRWRYFVDKEESEKGGKLDEARKRFLLGREVYSIYAGMMRKDDEKAGVFTMLDQALKLSSIGVKTAEDLEVKPERIEDLGDSIRIGDVTLPKGKGGPFTPKPNADYLADAAVLKRLYEYAKALSLGEPILLMGETAAGKTSDLEYLFFRMNMNMRYKNLDSDTAIEEVIGGYGPGKRQGEMTFVEGMLPRAMEEHTGAFLDEFNLNPLVEWMNTVIDDDRLYMPHRIVEGHPYLVAAANPPEVRYPGRVLLSPAVRSRWTEIWIPQDTSVARLTKLMGHWLKGGTMYSMFLTLAAAAGSASELFRASSIMGLTALPQVYGKKVITSPQPSVRAPILKEGQSLGTYTPKPWPWYLSLALPYIIGGMAAGLSIWAVALPSLIFIVATQLSTKQTNDLMPLTKHNASVIQNDVHQINIQIPSPIPSWASSSWEVSSPALTDQAHYKRLAALGMLDLTLSAAQSDLTVLLSHIAVSETTPRNFEKALEMIEKIGGPKALEALEYVARQEPQFPSPGMEPLWKNLRNSSIPGVREQIAQNRNDAENVTQLAEAAKVQDKDAKAASLILEAETVLQTLAPSRSWIDQLKTTAITQRKTALELAVKAGEPDAVLTASQALEALMRSRSLQNQGLNALPTGSFFAFSPWEKIKDLFRSKKKGTDESDDPDDKPEPPPSLEDILKTHKIPETDWPAYRAKVERIQTMMRMVGSSISRDTNLQWKPGDWWAFYPGQNFATYPFEHLVTHSEEELVGVIDHESLHREITVADERFPLMRQYMEDPVKHYLWNGLEDPRINSRGIHRLPGAERYLHALYNRYFPKDLKAAQDPSKEAGDLTEQEGDTSASFDPRALQYPHIEFVAAAIYHWRYGEKLPQFVNKSAEEAFDKALPDIQAVFDDYPRGNDPSQEERLAHTMSALKRIDEKIRPLYDPLVKESEKKLSKQMKNGRGKNKKGKGQGGAGGGAGMPQQNPPKQKDQPKSSPNKNDGSKQDSSKQKEDKDGQGGGQGKEDEKKDGKKEEKNGGGGSDKKEDKKEDKKGGGGDSKKDDDKEGGDKESDAAARKAIQDHARRMAKDMGGKLKEAGGKKNKKDKTDAKKDKKKNDSPDKGDRLEPGDDAPEPLSIEDIAQTQRDMLLNRKASPFESIFQTVSHLVNPMITHLENLFQKNSRPRDVGYYKKGKRPDVKRYMKRQGEGGVKDDYMLRRAQKTKRRYKVTILVDESGSVAGYKHEMMRAVVLLVSALTRLQIDVEIIGFGETAIIHKEFNKTLSPPVLEQLIADLNTHIGTGGATHDADAVKLAKDRIIRENAERKSIWVVTDGEGNGPSKMADILPEAAQAQIHVMGVGVMEGMAYVKNTYPHNVLVHNIDDLPLALKAALEEYIQNQEKGASAAAKISFQPPSTAPPGLNALPNPPAPQGFPKPFFYKAHEFLSDCRVPLLKWTGRLMFAIPALIGLLFGFMFAIPALVAVPVSMLLAGGILERVLGRYYSQGDVSEQLNIAARTLFKSLPPQNAQAALAALEKLRPEYDGRRTRTYHPFLLLVHKSKAVRKEAWEEVFPDLAASPEASAKLLETIIRAYGSYATPSIWPFGEYFLLNGLGSAGRKTLLGLLKWRGRPDVDHPKLSVDAVKAGLSAGHWTNAELETLRNSVPSIEHLGDETKKDLYRAIGDVMGFELPNADLSAGTSIRERAVRVLASMQNGSWMGRVRQKALEDALKYYDAAMSSSDSGSMTVAAQRLQTFLDGAARP